MRLYRVKVTRSISILAANATDAAERGLNLIQRQKAWPEDLYVEMRTR